MSFSQLPEPNTKGYETVEARMKTYNNWPSWSAQKPIELAKAGLIFTGNTDKVRCVFCSGAMYNWDDQDVPMNEHTRHYPGCSFVKYTLVHGTIPYNQGPHSTDMKSYVIIPPQHVVASPLYRVEGSSRTQEVADCVVPAHNQSIHAVTAHAIPAQTQVLTAHSIPAQTKANVNQPIDCADNGGAYNKQPQKIENNSIVKVVLKLGYTQDQISKAITLSKLKMETLTVNDLLDALYTIEDNGYNTESDTESTMSVMDTKDKTKTAETSPGLQSYSDYGSTSTSKMTSFSQSQMETSDSVTLPRETQMEVSDSSYQRTSSASQAVPTTTTAVPAVATAVPSIVPEKKRATPTNSKLEQLTKEYYKLKQSRTCCLCKVVESSILFLPCRHLICCEQCANDSVDCPKCLKEIMGTVKVYHS